MFGYTRVQVYNSTHLHFQYFHNAVRYMQTHACTQLLTAAAQDNAIADEFWIVK